MKRKTFVLLSSIMASGLLVGGAFAAYAVHDKAEERGIYTTPGSLSPEDTVTLKWGAATGLSDVDDLVPGEQKKAGAVVLVAEVSDANAYLGNLLVHYEDTTNVDEELREYKFIDYLNVYIYEGELETPDEEKLVGSLLGGDEEVEDYRKNIPLEGSAIGETYTIFIELDESIGEHLDKITGDRVYVGFDWNKAAGDHDAEPEELADGYYLAGNFTDWEANLLYKMEPSVQVEGQYEILNVILNQGNELKAISHQEGKEDAYIPDGDNIVVAPGTYDIYFRPVYYANWDGEEAHYQDQFGIAGHFWFAPVHEEPEPVDPYLFSIEHNAGMGRGVFVAGQFTNWTLDVAHRLSYDDKTGVWSGTFPAEPGSEYKFIIADYETAANADWDTLNQENRTVPAVNPDPVDPGTSSQSSSTSESSSASEPVQSSEEVPVVVNSYYLIGSFNDWAIGDNEYILVADPVEQGKYSVTVNLPAETVLKVVYVGEQANTWFTNAAPWENCGFTLADDGNGGFNVRLTGAATAIDFYVNGTNGNHIVPHQ